jgi:hypothetical protein
MPDTFSALTIEQSAAASVSTWIAVSWSTELARAYP